MIPQRNLSLLSNRLARAGGRRIPEAVLERDYCIAWFLAGLSGTPLADRLAFKGGTAIKHCYFGDYRFSEDLDFTLVDEIEFDTIRRQLDRVFAAIWHPGRKSRSISRSRNGLFSHSRISRRSGFTTSMPTFRRTRPSMSIR